jgi:hypothetical protein
MKSAAYPRFFHARRKVDAAPQCPPGGVLKMDQSKRLPQKNYPGEITTLSEKLSIGHHSSRADALLQH